MCNLLGEKQGLLFLIVEEIIQLTASHLLDGCVNHQTVALQEEHQVLQFSLRNLSVKEL